MRSSGFLLPIVGLPVLGLLSAGTAGAADLDLNEFNTSPIAAVPYYSAPSWSVVGSVSPTFTDNALFTRDIANITMDLNNVEHVEFRALGGADNITVGDLSGTDVNQVEIDLRGPDGGGDGAADTVTVNGTNGADVVGAAGDAGGVHVFGLHATVDVQHSKAWNREILATLVAEQPELAQPIAEGALMRLTAGARCFDRYRREMRLSEKAA